MKVRHNVLNVGQRDGIQSNASDPGRRPFSSWDIRGVEMMHQVKWKWVVHIAISTDGRMFGSLQDDE